jgi:hypothetical protein
MNYNNNQPFKIIIVKVKVIIKRYYIGFLVLVCIFFVFFLMPISACYKEIQQFHFIRILAAKKKAMSF